MADSPFTDHTTLFSGPYFHVDLSGLDARHPVHYSQRLLIFRCSSSEQRDAQLAAFKTGLQALVERCPLLGGIVAPLSPDEARDGREDWCTIVPGKGMELIVRDLRTAIPSFEELEAADFPTLKLPFNLLMPVPAHIGNDRPFAACKMQFSAIEGGSILTWSMTHCLADGSGNNELMRVLSEETRLARKGTSSSMAKEVRSTGIGLDRSIILDLKSDLPFNIEDHPAYLLKTPPPANPPPAELTPHHPFQATGPETEILLRISPASLAQLKADATTPGAPHISTHDALVALIWRTVLLVRSRRSAQAKEIPALTLGSVFFPSDARRHLNLPQSYVGNAVYQLTAALDLGTLLSPSGLKEAASTIRRAITAVNPGKVSSLLAKTNETWIDWQFMNSYSTTGVAMGTDWTSGVLYSQDWGEAFGPLVRYRYPSVEGEGGCCVLPKLPDGSAEVTVGVIPEEEAVVRGFEGFGKYLDAR
jgi:hypothetical protein